jgi:hypothetical protein
MATYRTFNPAVAVVATGIFATAVLVASRLLVSGIDAGGSAEVFAANGGEASLDLTTSSAPGSALDVSADLGVPTTSAGTNRPESLPAAVRLDGAAEGGEITVSVIPLDGGPFHHDDEVRFRITVFNSGNEYLWGVYAYLEGYGRVGCSDRRLAPGEASECIARVRLDAEDYVADAWATAWTETEEIRSQDRYTAHIET